MQKTVLVLGCLAAWLLVFMALRPKQPAAAGFRTAASHSLAGARPTPRPARPADTSRADVARVLADVERRAYFLEPAAQPGALAADNPAQHLTAALTAAAYAVTAAPSSSVAAPAWQLDLQLRGIGRGGRVAFAPVAGAAPRAAGGKVVFEHGPAFAVDYDNSPAGLRQNFTLRQRPAGRGPVEALLTIDTRLRVTCDGQALSLRLAPGRPEVARYAGLRAWDATGRDLPAHLRLRGTALALVVDDQDAQYPLTIDPLVSTTAPTALVEPTGEFSPANNNIFGSNVSGAGDVNGDGYGDMVVVADGVATGARIYLYLGSSTGPNVATVVTITQPAEPGISPSGFNNFGGSVSRAGDVNGDGYADLIIGARATNNGDGRAYLYRGSSSGLNVAGVTTLFEPPVGGVSPTGGYFGTSVAGAGDVDGDGYADVVVGGNGSVNGQGRAYFYRGSSTGLNTTPLTLIEPSSPGVSPLDGNAFGLSAAGAGDVNGDGYADLVIGASRTSSGQGRTYLYLGSSSGLNTATVTTLSEPSSAANNQFGFRVAGAGDVNGDGYADLLVAANRTSSAQGRVYLYLGSGAGLNVAGVTTLSEPGAATNNLFTNISAAGDVDGDGYGDVLIGAQGTSSSQGRAYFYRGSSTGLNVAGVTTLVQPGAATSNVFGVSVAGAGDLNGDGYADLVIGAQGTSSRQGRTYVYYGAASAGPGAAVAATAAVRTYTGQATSSSFGYSTASAGDVNGDGYADVIVGALQYNGSRGRAYLYLGSSTGLPATAAQTLDGEAASSFFGRSVAGAGDVNGDGYDDVIIGGETYNGNVGRAYLHLGNSGGISTTADRVFTGETAGSRLGISVAGAGDINADGYADLVIGAYGYNSFQGRVYVYLGGSTGPEATASTTLTGAATGATFGNCVAGAGDVNGDGYADVLIAANQSGGNRGQAYIYLGSSTGLATTATHTFFGSLPNDFLGERVAGAGDLNGDGYADVLIGVRGFNSNQGQVIVGFGRSSGIPTTTILTGETGTTLFGTSVAGAGDVNGDGYADLLVGAVGYNSTQGRAYLYLGGSTLGTTAASVITGEAANNTLGRSVAGTGDVNGDGYGDFIVGADQITTATGKAYVFVGNGNVATVRRGNLRLYNTDLSTRLDRSNFAAAQFGLGLFARSTFGRVQARVAWETAAEGQPFGGTPVGNGVAVDGRGAYADVPVGGTELKTLVPKAGGRASKVRARLEYQPSGVSGTPRYGPWTYLSDFQLGRSGSSSTPLPVTLTAFTAAPDGPAAVQLRWTTAQEQNNAGFAVERSFDGRNFEHLAQVAGAGTTTTSQHYALRDARLPAGAAVVYYRLVQQDFSGHHSLSAVRTVTLAAGAAGFQVYPTVVGAGQPLHYAGAPATGGSLQVYSVLGRCVGRYELPAGGQGQVLLGALKPGWYLVRLAGGGHKAQRVFVQP